MLVLYIQINYFQACRLCLISSQIKNGSPINEVITPTGNTAGEIIVRAIVSHKTRNIIPKDRNLEFINLQYSLTYLLLTLHICTFRLYNASIAR